MAVSLKPTKFYGSNLPRPQIYANQKYSDNRVDPPKLMTDPLISWAKDVHWSMGGLSFKKTRHQGKIEGNLQKLREEEEKIEKEVKIEKNKKIKRKSREDDDVIDFSFGLAWKAGNRRSKRPRRLVIRDEDDGVIEVE
ncbi:hypothetical protein IFM89_004575 [Coptis chinensis]|uniref:Uncharacterized protein n=1 Tax=Coptis chinensis TaxID=261450 RepID=A0A835LLC1_9MAGN|nr:hypothetical protein IFM89_004575 [Coptis chinensis]